MSKQKSAMQQLIDELKKYQTDKKDNHEMLIGLKIAESLAVSKLELEKQQIIDAYNNSKLKRGSAEEYFNDKFITKINNLNNLKTKRLNELHRIFRTKKTLHW